MQVERAVFGSILEQRVEVHKAGWNVATFQRRDVGSTNIEVNKRQRRNVSTSRRQRDFCLSIIKSKKGDQNSGNRGSYERGHENQNSSDLDLEEEKPTFVFSSFLIKVLMFYRLNIYVLTFIMF